MGLLSLAIWVPIAFGVLLLLLGRDDQAGMVRWIALVGALAGQMLVRLTLDGEKVIKEERMLQGRVGRIRDVRMGPDGFVYLLTDEAQGRLLRLEPVKP